MLLLIVRYRDWRRALAAFLPSLLVPIIVLSGFALAGVETNLLHAVSLLIVMGMGVDYGIFIVDSAEEGTELGATLVSCMLCCSHDRALLRRARASRVSRRCARSDSRPGVGHHAGARCSRRCRSCSCGSAEGGAAC